jgi:hypothetical protein
MNHNIDWSKSTNGVMLCSFDKTIELMPEVKPILDELVKSGELEMRVAEYVVDVKIHMLMPKQYPCIPNWHRDFVPRNKDLERDFHAITGEKMYMWLSGSPLTEYLNVVNYSDGQNKKELKAPQQWHSFTQNDLHRGTVSEEHTWRCFIRVIPKKFIHPSTINVDMPRIHTQVYLDANKFNW